MALYARQPARRTRQLVADVAVVVWTVSCALLGLAVHHLVAAVAEPARRAAGAAARVSDSLRSAGTETGAVPGLGEQLRRPIDSAADSVRDLVTYADQQVATIERLATVTGWLVFALPALAVLAVWLPRRIGFVRRSRAAQEFLDSTADLDLFALRAMATQPMHVLARINHDPVGAWRAGDRAVIHQLAELELQRTGLRAPDRSWTRDDAGVRGARG